MYGIPDRNRALHGDIVAVRLKPRQAWRVNEEGYASWKAKSLASAISGLELEADSKILPF